MKSMSGDEWSATKSCSNEGGGTAHQEGQSSMRREEAPGHLQQMGQHQCSLASTPLHCDPPSTPPHPTPPVPPPLPTSRRPRGWRQPGARPQGRSLLHPPATKAERLGTACGGGQVGIGEDNWLVTLCCVPPSLPPAAAAPPRQPSTPSSASSPRCQQHAATCPMHEVAAMCPCSPSAPLASGLNPGS